MRNVTQRAQHTFQTEQNRSVCLSHVLFSDSGIIGTREFVKKNYQRFKHIFLSKNEKITKLISGLDGVYFLKRLS